MSAIRTTKLGATDSHGERIRARYGTRTVTVPYDYGLTVEAAHATAALKLARNLYGEDVKVEVTGLGHTRGYDFQPVVGTESV